MPWFREVEGFGRRRDLPRVCAPLSQRTACRRFVRRNGFDAGTVFKVSGREHFDVTVRVAGMEGCMCAVRSLPGVHAGSGPDSRSCASLRWTRGAAHPKRPMNDNRPQAQVRDLDVVSLAMRGCRRLFLGACCIGFIAAASNLVTLTQSLR